MIKIVENALPNQLFESLKQRVTNFSTMPWMFCETSAYPDDTTSEIEGHYTNKDFSWAHMAIGNGEWVSPLAELCYNSLLVAADKIPMNVHYLDRARFGMHTSQETPIINPAHVDKLEDHWAALLYINDSDGDTIFYDAYYEEGTDIIEYWKTNKDSWKVEKRITPKANTMVFFNGLQFHSSSPPTKSTYRIALNYNFYVA